MKRNAIRWAFACGLFMLCQLTYGQFQLPNGDFESWTTPPLAAYMEPSGNWWTTLNTVSGLGAPVTVTRSTDAHGGSYAAQLRTAQWGTLILPGLVVSGEFDIQNPSFLIQGRPCTDVPHAFQGWYKYSPVSGDSAGIAALLTRWNSSASRRDTLAIAALSVTSAQPAWTLFDLPFVTRMAGTPDSILVALVSSGDGANFNGQVGSTLLIDDLSLSYATSADPGVSASPVSIRSDVDGISITVPAAWAPAQIQVSDLGGRVCYQGSMAGTTTRISQPLVSGMYLFTVQGRGQKLYRQKVIISLP